MARSADNANTSANGKITSGIYEAIVVSHLDKNYMGTLLVDILRSSSSNALPERVGTSIEARYLMPFYGTTHRDATTPNDGYSATQKTYGMWMVPPDVGTRVLVVYVEGISRCYWIGCIPDQYMNFMVPDGRASTELTTDITPDNLRGNKLPVGEYNKKIAGDREILDPTRMRKPYNKDFTQILEVQGLLGDENRGTTTTSARREVPSSVFGVNTPGPLDKRDGAPRSEQGQAEYKANVFSNRLGGSSFVMDDGDDKFLRKTTADAGPPEYVNKEAGETGGDPTVPHNELVRIRTRTGHQILMHNSEDLIYIGNGRGTTWIELTSDGKIDIYANDSISVHSDQDINFTADRDVNIEAGRNINMNANSRYTEQDDSGEDKTSGNINIESKFDTNLRVGRNLKTHVEGTRDSYTRLSSKITVDSNREDLTLGYHYNYTLGEISVLTDASYKLHATAGTANILASEDVNLQSSSANINLQAAVQIAGDGGPKIYWNSGKSTSAIEPNTATESAKVDPQPFFNLPKVTPGTIGGAVQSIVKRMPTHEPWTHHENLNPLEFRPDKTDIQVEDNIAPATVVFTTDTFTKNRSRAAEATTDRRQPLDPVTQSQAPGAKPVTPTTSTGDVDAPPAVTGPINVPSNLLDFIKSKEGFHSKAFWDYQQYTNGYGTKARSSTEVITEAEAERRLGVVVTRTRNYVVSYGQELGRNWSDEQIGALTSFAFNLGNGALKTLTANGTRSDEVIMEKIKLYNKAGGRTLQGLVTRRNEESAWFAKGLA
jgi:GH24 family phage-related lysozyme (muramidase)